jgi:hypothetical protein
VIVGVTLIAFLTMKGRADWRLRAIARWVSGRSSRYQQVALVLTLLSVGVMLVSGANWRFSLGTALIGLTLSWTVGSDNRLLHYMCLVVGIATLITPACLSWRQHRLAVREFDRSVQEFEVNIPRLAERYPLSAACPVASKPQSKAQSVPIHSRTGQYSASDIEDSKPAGDVFDQVRPRAASAGGLEDSPKIDLSAGLEDTSTRAASGGAEAKSPAVQKFDFIPDSEEQVIPINNSTELYAVLTQMNYPESEKESIEARIAKDLDSKKIGRADWVFSCLSIPESKVDFQISSATGKEFLEFLPPWFMDAVVKGVNVTSVPANEKPGAPPSEFRVLPAFWSLPLVSFLGIVIGLTGGVNLTRLRRKDAVTTP